MNTRSFLLATLIAGIVMGLLSDLPLINMGNCLCCLWVWASSILAVFLYRRFSKEAPGLSLGQAAGLGALTGLIGALLGTGVGALLSGGIASTISILQSQPALAEVLKNTPMDVLRSGDFTLIGMIIDILVYALVGALGGVLSVTVIWKTTPKP
jgi:hypothetical protein